MKMINGNSTYSDEYPTCPYCGAIDYDFDLLEFPEPFNAEQFDECPSCGREFKTQMSISYYSWKTEVTEDEN